MGEAILESSDRDSVVKVTPVTPIFTSVGMVPHVMTKIEAAAYLRVSLRKLDNDIAARRLPFIKNGRRIYFRREALDGALRKMEVQSVG
jgi:excisionase family DNA binding protein